MMASMNEDDWLDSTDPLAMLECARPRLSLRKQRLFMVAACRRIWDLLPSESLRKTVDAHERYAEGLLSEEEFEPLRNGARMEALWRSAGAQLMRVFSFGFFATFALQDKPARAAAEMEDPIEVARLVISAAGQHARDARRDAWRQEAPGREEATPPEEELTAATERALAETGVHLADGLRDLVGPSLFRKPTGDRGWLDANAGRVRRMAQALYEERRYADLPFLADALEESGCENRDILEHLRSSAEHVRGCWALNLLVNSADHDDTA